MFINCIIKLNTLSGERSFRVCISIANSSAEYVNSKYIRIYINVEIDMGYFIPLCCHSSALAIYRSCTELLHVHVVSHTIPFLSKVLSRDCEKRATVMCVPSSLLCTWCSSSSELLTEHAVGILCQFRRPERTKTQCQHSLLKLICYTNEMTDWLSA
jgi:hypothetical protein